MLRSNPGSSVSSLRVNGALAPGAGANEYATAMPSALPLGARVGVKVRSSVATFDEAGTSANALVAGIRARPNIKAASGMRGGRTRPDIIASEAFMRISRVSAAKPSG